MKHVNVAVVSIGGAGRAHSIRLQKNSKSKLRAIFDPSRDRLDDFKENTTGAVLTTDFDDILTDSEIDAVSVCSPDGTHSRYAVDAIKAGKHVLVEKPMVTSIEQCKEISSALDRSPIVFGVHHQMRYVPSFLKARGLVSSGAIGLALTAEADYVHDMRERAFLYDGWRASLPDPQNIVLGASSHTIDLLRWMLDDEVVEVFSYSTRIGWPEYPEESTVVTVLKFAGGAIGKVASTIASRRPQLNSLSLHGTDGAIINNLHLDQGGLNSVICVPSSMSFKAWLGQSAITALIKRIRPVQQYPFSVYEHETACCALLDEFLTSILEGTSFPVGFSEGAYTVQICIACIESYQTGCPVRVERMF